MLSHSYLEGAPHPLRQFGLGHAEFLEGLGEGLAGMDRVIRLEKNLSVHN